MTPLSDAAGLMAFWSRIDDDYALRFQQWHNCEHVPERVLIPGFLRGRRYRVSDGAPSFLMMYETSSPEVLSSKPYLAALNAPTDWTREALTHFREPSRNVYRRLGRAGEAGPFCAPWLTALRFNREEGLEAELADPWLAAMVDAAGVDRAQLWAVDEAVSGIVTSERRIYGGGPGAQQFLLLIESHRPHERQDDAIAAADAQAPQASGRQNEILGRYWLEICHTSPETQETSV